MIALVKGADISEAADAYKLGIPERVNSITPADNGAVMARSLPEAPVTHFPAFTWAPGFKIVREKIMHFGGIFGVASGPRLDHPRTRVPARNPGHSPGVRAVAVTRMPAGMTPTVPHWEAHLFGSDGYLAS